MSGAKKQIVIPKQVLLVEIERRCRLPECQARVRLSLTKAEAHGYSGFKCEQCGSFWSGDSLTERDIPEWWDEFVPAWPAQVARVDASAANEAAAEEEGSVRRLSDAYRRTQEVSGKSQSGEDQV